MVQRSALSVGNRSGYLSSFTNAACTPSLASNGKTMCRTRASQPSIESILLQVQLRWAGHITRMEDVHMPKAVFFRELQEGKRDRCTPRKRYKDQRKRQLAQAGIGHQSRQQEASDRDSWRSSVRKASCKFEAEKHEAVKEKRRRQKNGQHPYHPYPTPSSVQSAIGCAHQESVCTATNERASIARNEPSSSSSLTSSSSHACCLKKRPTIIDLAVRPPPLPSKKKDYDSKGLRRQA